MSTKYEYPIETLKNEIAHVTSVCVDIEKEIVKKEDELAEVTRLANEEITSLNDSLKITNDKLQSLEDAIKKLASPIIIIPAGEPLSDG